MIPVIPKPEPSTFDQQVRQPGSAFLSKVARPTTKEWSNHRYWGRSLQDLWTSYDGICAYCCCWIPRDTGIATVDHFLPKSEDPTLAYEWENFRLASLKMNSRKGTYTDVLDPFSVQSGWFHIRFPSLLISPNGALPSETITSIQQTIRRLRLNEEPLVKSRLAWIQPFCMKQTSFDFLKRRAPFLAYEIERQGLIHSLRDIYPTAKSSDKD